MIRDTTTTTTLHRASREPVGKNKLLRLRITIVNEYASLSCIRVEEFTPTGGTGSTTIHNLLGTRGDLTYMGGKVGLREIRWGQWGLSVVPFWGEIMGSKVNSWDDLAPTTPNPFMEMDCS
jgi:hypothetical protein